MIIQNDAGTVVGANSYVGYSYAGSYLASRVNLASYTDEQIADALCSGTLFIDTYFDFNGEKLTGENQATKFPRTGAVAGIPEAIKKATCEYAIWYLEMAVALHGAPPVDYFGDKYIQRDNTIKTYVHDTEIALADGCKYVTMSEKFIYEAGLFQLIE
jgi:hypothetical protein